MIKVIKSGSALEEYYFKCYKCHCYFTATKGDAKKVEEYGSKTTYYLNCPECKQEIVRSNMDLNHHDQKSLKRELGLIKPEEDEDYY